MMGKAKANSIENGQDENASINTLKTGISRPNEQVSQKAI